MTPTRSRTLTVGILVVVAAAGIAIFAGTRDSGTKTTPTSSGTQAVAREIAPVTVSGAALDKHPDSGTDPAVGKTAPVVSGTDFFGTPVTIGTPGTPQVVLFVAHWCPHCQNEMPKIVSWTANGLLKSETKLQVVSTGVDQRQPNYPPSTWLTKVHWPGPTLVDSPKEDALNAYGLTSFPYYVALDRNGKVVFRTSGELSLTQLQALLGMAARG